MSFAVWLTGLSGSGKSAIARELLARLHARGLRAAVLESDVLRTQLTPHPRYDEAERDFFYGALARLGAELVAGGRPVIFDATANRRRYRDAARSAIARFAEVYVDTPLEVCRARDVKGLNRAAQAGGSTTLPGAQAPYEAPAAPELVVHGERGSPGECAEAVLAWLRARGWIDEPDKGATP
jgi:adenylylsulfate kinase